MNGSTTIVRAKRKPRRVLSPQAMFLQEFIKHPVMVGSIIPSSGKLIRKMLSRVDWANTRVFVEYGPGVGTFCRAILDRLGPDARYVAIDTNPDFVAYLRVSIVDPRFSAIHGAAEDVSAILADHKCEHADYVLSGLPFSTLPPGVGDAIAAATRQVLRPGGAFLVYQFNPNVRNFLTPQFARIDHDMEWWNVPPAQLWWAWKDDAGIDAAGLAPAPRHHTSCAMDQLNLGESEWRQRLTPTQFHALREAGTEKADGIYYCAGCQLELFDSDDKCDSGSGWPSFTQPVAANRISEHSDTAMAWSAPKCATHDATGIRAMCSPMVRPHWPALLHQLGGAGLSRAQRGDQRLTGL